MRGTEFAHAATVCARIERDIRAAIERTQSAILDAQAAAQAMLDVLDEGRAARGLPPLYANPTATRSASDEAHLFYTVKEFGGG